MAWPGFAGPSSRPRPIPVPCCPGSCACASTPESGRARLHGRAPGPTEESAVDDDEPGEDGRHPGEDAPVGSLAEDQRAEQQCADGVEEIDEHDVGGPG